MASPSAAIYGELQVRPCQLRIFHLSTRVDVLCEYSTRTWADSDANSLQHLILIPRSTQTSRAEAEAKRTEVWLSETSESRWTRLSIDPIQFDWFVEYLVLPQSDEGYVPLDAAILIVPLVRGFVVHSDFVAHRMIDCDWVNSARSFMYPLGEVSPTVRSAEQANAATHELVRAIETAVGAIRVTVSVLENHLKRIELDLCRRLTFPWLAAQKPPERRVAIICPKQNIDVVKWRYDVLMALGIKCVIMSAGSWWTEAEGGWHHLREAFIPFDTTPDENAWERIVDTVRSYPRQIHGIMALMDSLQPHLARAAEVLGVFGHDPKAITMATDKFQTKRLEGGTQVVVLEVNSLAELERYRPSLVFPLICKPSSGADSEGVFRVDRAEQLQSAVLQTLAISSTHRALIEPYVDGPEVDVNLVLHEGRLLYGEVVDDFPSPADLITADEDSITKPFSETQTISPSKLPKVEQDMLIAATMEVVQRLRLTTGIFHCEARVQNSTMTYRLAPGQRIIDLHPVRDDSIHPTTTAPAVPSCFLHEVNPRAPGMMSSNVTRAATGIDYWALGALCAISDWGRMEALSRPYLSTDGQQYHALSTNINFHVGPSVLAKAFPGLPPALWDKRVIDHNPLKTCEFTNMDPSTKTLSHNAVAVAGVKYGATYEWIYNATVVIRSSQSREACLCLAAHLPPLYEAALKEHYGRDEIERIS